MSGGDRAESWSEYLRRIEKADHRGILLKYNRTVKSTEIQSGVVRLVSTDHKAERLLPWKGIIRNKWKMLTYVVGSQKKTLKGAITRKRSFLSGSQPLNGV